MTMLQRIERALQYYTVPKRSIKLNGRWIDDPQTWVYERIKEARKGDYTHFEELKQLVAMCVEEDKLPGV
jgi:hypothetical protein